MSHFHSHSHKTGFLLLGCTQKERIIQMCDAFFLICQKGSPYPAPALGNWLIETDSLVTSYGLWFGFCFRRLQSFPNDIFYVLPHIFEVALDVKV